MIIYALVMAVLLLFAGIAVDAGLLYVTKAKLSAAVDSATLTGMKNLQSGQTTAATLATGMFDANYGGNPPTPTVTFPTASNGNLQVQVTATAQVHTLFMRYLSQWRTVPVSDTAVATRGNLIMSIVLDRSGSMCGGTVTCPQGVTGDDGGEALQSAVPTFVGKFDNTVDEVALISFSENSTINFPIGYSFITPITTAVAAMQFTGGTFGTGAGTGTLLSPTIGAPLSLADAQNNSVTVTSGENVIKVVVYFTDGLMNTIQDNFHCGGKTNNTLTLLNYGGFDTGSDVDIFDPTSATNVFDADYAGGSGGFTYDTNGDICKDASGNIVTKFVSQQNGSETFSRTNVTAEAQYRAIHTAIAMRTESPIPTYIYTIGLGNSVTTATQDFLAQLANDPSYPSTYILGQPAGEFFYVSNCPSSTCTTSLNTVFQTIASKVLLRLTQ
ncbi:MAG: pilus assembly protein TadG-related protein [Candidatus Korobacteraceae bacterium]|jgi:hypothetical protein